MAHASEPDVSLRSTIRMTDLTRLVGERKQVELQLLKLEQALSALETDANLNGVLRPELSVSDDANESMAAVGVMIAALQQRRANLAAEIEAARHRRHDAATEMQEQREARLLAHSEQSMKTHLQQSKRAADLSLRKIAQRNTDHERRVGQINVSRQIETSRALSSLQKSIAQRDRADEEKRRQREEERAVRYAEHCRKERERMLRLEQLETLRGEHHTALRQKRDSRDLSNLNEKRREAARARPMQQQRQDRSLNASPENGGGSEEGARPAGTGLSAIRDLHRSATVPSRSISPSLLMPPGRARVESMAKLDARTAAGKGRHKRHMDRTVARLGQAHAELDGKRRVHKEQRYREVMRAMNEGEERRAAIADRIDGMRREQETIIEQSRLERGQRTDEAIRKSQLREGDMRWSRRAQRLIESVCADVDASLPPQ